MLALLLWPLLQPAPKTRVLFWNLENFFDYYPDSTSTSELEFTSRGARRWTKKRFQAKCDAIAKTILWAAAEEGAPPDAIGLAEVENALVLKRLLQNTGLCKLDYSVVHFESPDRRGIDVALLYRRSRLRLEGAGPRHLFRPDSTILPTRDILLAAFLDTAGNRLALLVNHHPSKFGGAALSGTRREIAVSRLGELADSLQQGGTARIVAMGDFNETPDHPVYGRLSLQNLALPLHRRGVGSIKFGGSWELIDHFYVSKAVRNPQMKVLHVPFLQVPDRLYGGTKPLRTYSGPRYLGGVSDHCPVWLEFE